MSDFSSGHDLAVCGSEPALGSVLTAQSLEPASDSVSPSLSAAPLPPRSHSVSLSKINIKKNFFKENKQDFYRIYQQLEVSKSGCWPNAA